jgi:hypothetical protein
MNMKKIMLIAAAAAGLVASAEVASGVVGYNTVTIDKQWTIMSVNFTKPDGSAMTINEAFPYVEGMTQGASGSGDEIQIQNGTGGYDTYYMSNGKVGKNTYPDIVSKWVKAGASVVADRTVPPGTAFWYKAQSYATPFTVTVAGGVITDVSKSIPINATWTHIANPYPVALSLNDSIGYVVGMTQGASGSGDEIQIQNGTGGYDTYYMSNGKVGKNTYPDIVGKWVKAGTSVTSDASIPVGKGAWYKRQGSTDFDLTITKPYDL